jgi:hypothetical protein
MNVCEVGIDLHVCFGVVFPLGIYKRLWMGWHVETGATLSVKHVLPVGSVAFEARC